MEHKKTNIFLIGFMGSGKSSVSRVLHKKYHMEQLEMDEEIERQEKMTISEIFEKKGEACFRDLETNLLDALTDRENLVVSCGGGTAGRKRSDYEKAWADRFTEGFPGDGLRAGEEQPCPSPSGGKHERFLYPKSSGKKNAGI